MKSKKNIFSILTIALLATTFIISIASCNKDDDKPAAPVYQEQNPLATYLSLSGFNQEAVNQIDADDYEFGFAFKPQVKGKITGLVMKLPAESTTIRVTIWNKQTGAIVRTENVTNIIANTEITKTIPDLVLVKDTEYMITMNSNDWYRRKKTSGAAASYPITAGDISITNSGYKSGSSQTIPNQFEVNYYAGDLSFKFIRTE